MSRNRGKPIEECVVEREAEHAWQRALMAGEQDDRTRKLLTASRKRATALGNRIRKLNREAAA